MNGRQVPLCYGKNVGKFRAGYRCEGEDELAGEGMCDGS